MAAPCVVDTCSVQSSIDPVTRRLQLDARLDPTGGLECGTDANPMSGLRVKLGENCAQLLSLTGAGALLASGSVRTHIEATNAFVAIPNNGDEATIQDFTLTNPFDCEAQAFMFGRYELRFNAGVATPSGDYRAHLQWRTLVGGSSSASAGAAAIHQHIGGGDGSNDNSSDEWDYFFGMFSWAAGATKQFEVLAKHFDVTNELLNLDTAGAGMGGQSYIGVAVFPLGNTAF